MKLLLTNFKKRNFADCLFFIVFLSMPLFSCTGKLPTKEYTITKTDGEVVSITLEIAQTDKERARGFMERKHIPDGTGMLFVFEKEQQLRFWMKNTPRPLSIAYIDKAGIIKEIHDLTPFSLETVASSFSCMYALEVPQGWFTRAGITVGAALVLSAPEK